MKTFFTTVNVLLGILMVLVNFQGDRQTMENTIGMIIGLLLIGLAIFSQLNKQWPKLILPIIPFAIGSYLFLFVKTTEGGGEYSLTAGPTILAALILMLFATIEAIYFAKKRS